MREFLRREGIKILIAFTSLSLGVFIIGFTPGKVLLPSFFDFFVNPMQQISGKVLNATSITNKTKTKEEYEEEIKVLKKELQKLRVLAVDYYDIKKENAQFLKFYDFKKQNKNLEFVPGEILSRDPNEFFGAFTLNKGITSGVNVNCPIITENGLVGRVVSVDANSCKVKTVLSQDIKIGVIDKQTNDSGVIVGNIKLADKNLTQMKFLSKENKIASGDIIVSSGLGGIFPKDMPIGTVKELKHDEFDSSFFAEVELFDNINELSDVFVITSFSGKSEAEDIVSKK